MKRYFVALAILALVPAFSQSIPNPASIALSAGHWLTKDSEKVFYIKVRCFGPTWPQARENCHRKAVEDAVGSLIFAASEVNNNQLTRNEVISYSSGYVKDSREINSQIDGNRYTLSMEVWVSDSKLASRLGTYGYAEGGEVKGKEILNELQRYKIQHQSQQSRASQAEDLHRVMLKDYPRMALNTKVNSTEMGVDKNTGRRTLYIEFNTSFTDEYIDAMVKTIKETREDIPFCINGCKPDGFTNVRIRTCLAFCWTNGGWTSNRNILNMWTTAFEKRSMDLEVSYYSRGVISKRECYVYTPEVFGNYATRQYAGNYYAVDYEYDVNANATDRTVLAVPNRVGDDAYMNWVGTIEKVEGRVMDREQCRATRSVEF